MVAEDSSVRLRFHGGIFLQVVGPLVRTFGGLLVAVLLGVWMAGDLTDALRYAGTILQVFGLFLVAIGISELRKDFGLPPLGDTVRKWGRLAKAIFVKPAPITVELSGVSASADMGGSAGMRFKLAPGTPLHKRVTLLEQQIEGLEAALDKAHNNLLREISNIRQATDVGLRARADEIANLATKLQRVTVGGIHLELMGLIWLFVGTILAGFPNELGELLLRL
jgi:hypothetical protein